MRNTHAVHLPPFARQSGPRPPRWPARLLAHLRGLWLDRQLARGAPSWQSPSHAARALQLTSDRSRRALADSLEQLAQRAEQRPAPFRGAAIKPCREQVRDALRQIQTVASRLRSHDPLDATGIARLHELVCDGGGPCYLPSYREALALALEDISRWLDVMD